MDTSKNLEQNIGQLVTECLSVLIEQNNTWDALHTVIQRIGVFTNADAGMIIHFDGTQNQGAIMTSYEKNGGSNALKTLEHTLLTPIETAYNFYVENQVMVLDDIHVFTKLCGICSQICSLTPLKKFYGVRLMVDGKVWGSLCILFVDTENAISDSELGMLKTLAHLAEICIMRELNRRNLVDERDNALAAEKAKSFFFASVSHNIRTPLNSILGFSELLKNDADPEERRQHLDNILESGRTLQRIVDNVLDLSKMSAGRADFHYAPCDFRKICNEIIQKYSPNATALGLALKLEAPEDFLTVMVDAGRLRQVLDMWFNNALKYTSQGGITLRTKLQGVVNGKATLQFEVEDTGCGIDAEHQQRLMRPYEQIGDNKTQLGGTGLSLALCKALAELMGGNFYLRSVVGKGSAFGMNLPVSIQEEKKADSCTCNTTAKSCATDGNAPCPCENFSVLVVDDVPLNLRLLSAYCKKIGVKRTDPAADGKEAMELLAKNHYDCILTDIWMPRMDGVDLARNLKNHAEFSKIPIYAITADVDFPKGENAPLFTDVLLKPVGADKLLELFRGLIY